MNLPRELGMSRRVEMGPCPLSAGQTMLWVAHKINPKDPASHRPAAFRLIGELDFAALERSLTEVVRRHEILRSVFVERDGEPMQTAKAPEAVAVQIRDLRCLAAEEREQHALRLAIQESCREFDLSTGPLFRPLMLRLKADDHLLLISMHHIVFDGWSENVLFQELASLYDAFCAKTEPALPAPAVQYADFAFWQRERLTSGILETQLAYWRKQLAGVQPLSLNTDYPRNAAAENKAAKQSIVLPPGLVEQLKLFSRNQKATLFMTLLATFQTLLSRYTAQADIGVGVPIAGRTDIETERLIGCFMNILVLRADLSGSPTVRELLNRTRAVALEAYNNQEVPVEKLIEELQPKRTANRWPLFQTMLDLRNMPKAETKRAGALEIRPFKIDTGFIGGLDLYLALSDDADGLCCDFKYPAALFRPDTIERMARHYRIILEGFVADPERRLADLPLLTDSEKYQHLIQWNSTKTDFPKDKCIHDLFERQVERSPEAVAVLFEDQQLTYRELNTKANQLAHYLRKAGVEADAVVGICMERSIDMLVALLAIVKAGGAYVPLDPAHPEERLLFMLHDAQTRFLLTQRRLLEKLFEDSNSPSSIFDSRIKVVCLDRDCEEIARESEKNPESGATAENLAYVIYTSGSTGTPKSVMISHRAVVNHALAVIEEFGLTNGDRVGQISSLSFDLSVEELFPSWIAGAAVTLRPSELISPGKEFLNWVKTERLTVLNLPTAFWREWVDVLLRSGRTLPPTLRLVVVGGEKASRQALDHWRNIAGGRVCWRNTYGPTETTVTSTCFDPVYETLNGDGVLEVSIGRPLANVQAYVLDRHLHPVPVGVSGELYIGGAGVARGYLNRPEPTGEKFLPDPFSNEPGSRLYKTGDLARYRQDGNLEFVGRIDDQVKIRGFRIEPGEIEAALEQHPAVRAAAVTAREDVLGNKQLLAYVVCYEEASASEFHLRSFLRAKLPDFMMPSNFVFLDSLPLTANGKIDRKALPVPTSNRPDLETAFVAPRNSTEKAIAAIWTELLRIERVGVHDNFFDLGGHSLLATRVISWLREACQVDLPLRTLFEAPTIAGLADAIERTPGSDLHKVEKKEPSVETEAIVFPASYAQRRLWFLQQFEHDDASYNLLAAFRIKGLLDVRALEQSLNEIVRRHEVLRTTFAVVDEEPAQIISPALVLTVAVYDLSGVNNHERETEAQRIVTEQSRHCFDLQSGPLFRATLVRRDEQDHLLLLNMHHIVADGWSMWILYRELSVLYNAFLRGEPSSLRDLRIQYADYAVWQRERLSGKLLEDQLCYWRRQLSGVPTLELPTDRPRPAMQTHRGARLSLAIPKMLSDGIKELSHKQEVTLFMTLLAAFQILLYRYTGQQDIAVGSPIANRTRAEIEDLIGFFVNTLVLRTDLSNNPTFRQLLTRVNEVALEAYEHQDLPFEKLVEELNPERNLSGSPLFQVMFVLQNAPRRALELPGLTVRPIEISSGTAKFDLLLSIAEQSGSLSATFEYNTDLFDDATISRMLGHYQTLLESIVSDPEQRLSELAILTRAERRQQLIEWNNTRRDYPENCPHELFEGQVERSPEAVAVVFEDRQLTYRELNTKANRLAHYLRKMGVEAETLVGICMEPSLTMAVSVLAVFKAGGACVPLDPAYPKERLAFMIQDAQPKVLLIQKSLLRTLPSDSGQFVCPDTDWTMIAGESAANPVSVAAADNLAYVIFTSGSTGRPKAVAMPHRVLSNLITRQPDDAGPKTSKTLQFSSLSFDVSFQEMFTTWCSGRTLMIPSRSTREDFNHLARFIIDSEIDKLFLPFVALYELAEAIHRQTLKPLALKEIITAGEQLNVTPAIMSLFRQLRHGCLRNEYGPSESHVVTAFNLTGNPEQWPLRPSIGSAIANVQIYLLDARLHPVPVGVTGEIYIGGAGLARGYLKHPDFTAERFVPDPFSRQPGVRLYKTGDLARHLADGNIVFMGRIDDQVKIRGFRIEIGEVEAVLRGHSMVREVVVLAREDAPGQKRLVAYVVSTPNQALRIGEMRSFVQSKLPEYMIPSAFVFLDSLPLTPNGKVDRKALPAPDRRPQLEDAFVAPRTKVEETLAGIWAELLKLERVGIHDDFFDLGGHSLLATQLISRLWLAFQLEIPLRLIFETPTIAALAESIETMQWTSARLQPEEIRREKRETGQI